MYNVWSVESKQQAEIPALCFVANRTVCQFTGIMHEWCMFNILYQDWHSDSFDVYLRFNWFEFWLAYCHAQDFLGFPQSLLSDARIIP
jgi:hypothetical protein